jgi:hypothetical protein
VVRRNLNGNRVVAVGNEIEGCVPRDRNRVNIMLWLVDEVEEV